MIDNENWSSQVAQWQAAANEGDGIAQYNLALCYIQGKGVERDDYRAYDLLVEACANLDEETQREELGYAYFNRAMTELALSNMVGGILHLGKAAEYGYVKAYKTMALLSGGLDAYDAHQLELTKIHDPSGAKLLEGIAYLYGQRSYPKDEEKGFALLSEAAEAGETDAADCLLQYLNMLWNTTGQYDLELIEHLISLASPQWAEFMYNVLGSHFISGIACTVDFETGESYFRKAIEEYNSADGAMNMLSYKVVIVQNGLSVELDEELFAHCLALIEDNPALLDNPANINVICYIAKAYEEGLHGLQKDAAKALYYYQKAEQNQLALVAHWKSEMGKAQLQTMRPILRKSLLKELKKMPRTIKKAIRRTTKQVQS